MSEKSFIELEIAEVTDELVLEVCFANPDAVPYKYLETLCIGDYKVVVNGTSTEMDRFKFIRMIA